MATKLKGYAGEYALIDLGSGEISPYTVTDEERSLYLGNKIQGAAIAHRLIKAHSDPLSPDNVLIFNTGPLTGSGAPTSAKFNVSFKSPLTRATGSSNSGGDFGIQLKKAGYDGIIITGKAQKPVMIAIENGVITIKDASHLWGLDTEKTQKALPAKSGKLAIGPAGENLVRFANIMSGDRALGRCGAGAVMGSKNLKALYAIGNKRLEPAEPEQFREVVREWTQILRKHPITGEILPKYGTANLVRVTSRTHTLPTRNYYKGSFEYADDVSGERMAETRLVKNYGCKMCPIHCGRLVELHGEQFKGPEFETLGSLGPNIENHDLDKIIEWNRIIDQLGMDTISTGVTLSFAMELKNRGMLDTDLDFGRTDNIAAILYDIAYKRGLGAELSEGSRWMSEKYGGKDFCMNTKGLEYAAYEPRGAVGHGLGYATANRGGCHLNGGYMVFFEATGPVTQDPLTPKAKPAYCVFQQNAFETISASGICIFTAYAILPGGGEKINELPVVPGLLKEVFKLTRFLLDHQTELPEWALPFHLPLIPHSKAVQTYTGIPMSLGRFLTIGDRGFNLERMFNVREGLSRLDDTLPRRLTHELQRPNEPRSKVPLEEMLPIYYKVRGWDENGIPTREKLKSLNIEWTLNQ